MGYDYKNGLKRIQDTLSSPNEVEVDNMLPKNESEWTFKNGRKAWVSALFVDIVDSTRIFTEYKDSTIAKLIRSFTKEIIMILKNNEGYRQIGIRGDCVYAIYSTPEKDGINDVFEDAVWINTFIKMFNKILLVNNFPLIKIGIGLAASETLVIKAGARGEEPGLNDKIWIGKSVSFASKLSSEAGRNYKNQILSSCVFYNNLTDENKKWFSQTYSQKINTIVYGCNVIKIEMNNWIEEGFPKN